MKDKGKTLLSKIERFFPVGKFNEKSLRLIINFLISRVGRSVGRMHSLGITHNHIHSENLVVKKIMLL